MGVRDGGERETWKVVKRETWRDRETGRVWKMEGETGRHGRIRKE